MTPEEADAFRASMTDRRTCAVAIFQGKLYTPPQRSWKNTTGVCLHQTACWMGERPARYDHTQAHFVVTRAGAVIWLFDLDRETIHGNGWNTQCVGIEVDGLYPGLEDDPATAINEALRTTWDDPTTPVREQPMQVTEVAMARCRDLVRWIDYEIARNDGSLHVLVAHRQASSSRENDPGEAIWKAVALPLHAELGLTDGGIGFKIGDGYPIPQAWDPRCVGVRY
jgi:hypothetical protein